MSNRERDLGKIWELLRRVDVLAGIVVGAIAVAIWVQAFSLDMGVIRNFGPGFLPKALGTGLAIAAIGLLAWGILQPAGRVEYLRLVPRGPAMVGIGILFFACFIKGWQLGPLQTPQFGLFIAGPITVILTGYGSKEAHFKELLVLGIGLTAAGVLLFSELLSMQIPIFPRFMEGPMVTNFGPDWPKRVGIVIFGLVSYGLARRFQLDFADHSTPQETDK